MPHNDNAPSMTAQVMRELAQETADVAADCAGDPELHLELLHAAGRLLLAARALETNP